MGKLILQNKYTKNEEFAECQRIFHLKSSLISLIKKLKAKLES